MKFVFDLDGTICFKGKPLSEEITNALEACRRLGHEVILPQPDRYVIYYLYYRNRCENIQW